MGAIEGMLRDHMLARSSRFPASYAEAEMRSMITSLLSLALTK